MLMMTSASTKLRVEYDHHQFVKKVRQSMVISISISVFFFFIFVLLVYTNDIIYSCSNTIASQVSLLHAMFNHSIDKKCVFLLCNGLLVFLAKSSGSLVNTSSSSSSSQNFSNDNSYYNNIESPPPPPSLFENESSQEVEEIKEVVVVESSNTEVGGHEQEARDEGEGEGEEIIVSKENIQECDDVRYEGDDDVHEEEVENESIFLTAAEEEEEEEGIGLLSTEELNRKFDEFIIRMKEEIRLEAQRHFLVLVK